MGDMNSASGGAASSSSGDFLQPARFVRARREVVLAAGAVQTPHLLLLSGIGPREELEAVGVPVAADVPGVGKNLQDHLFTLVFFEDRSEEGGKQVYTELERAVGKDLLIGKAAAFAEYLSKGTGVAAKSPVQAVCFGRSGLHGDGGRDGDPSSGKVDFEFHFLPQVDRFNMPNLLEQLNLGASDATRDRDDLRDFHTDISLNSHRAQCLQGKSGEMVVFCSSVLCPRSRGEIKLRSADPLVPPSIDPRYLTDEDGHDADVMAHGIRLARRICHETEAMRGLIGEELVDRSISHDPESQDYLRAYVRKNASTVRLPPSLCVFVFVSVFLSLSFILSSLCCSCTSRSTTPAARPRWATSTPIQWLWSQRAAVW